MNFINQLTKINPNCRSQDQLVQFVGNWLHVAISRTNYRWGVYCCHNVSLHLCGLCGVSVEVSQRPELGGIWSLTYLVPGNSEAANSSKKNLL